MNAPAIRAIIEMFGETLTSEWLSGSNQENNSPLLVGIDEQADIMCLHIKPTLPGYDKYKLLEDLRYTSESQCAFLTEFEATANDEYVAAEKHATLIVQKLIRERTNAIMDTIDTSWSE